jgi:2-keto-4-pentenoate hydratase
MSRSVTPVAVPTVGAAASTGRLPGITASKMLHASINSGILAALWAAGRSAARDARINVGQMVENGCVERWRNYWKLTPSSIMPVLLIIL